MILEALGATAALAVAFYSGKFVLAYNLFKAIAENKVHGTTSKIYVAFLNGVAKSIEALKARQN